MKLGRPAALGVVALALVALATAEEAPPSATVEVTYRIVGQAALPPVWDVILRPVASAGEPVRHRFRSPEPLLLQLPPGSSWEVSADLPGFWVQRKSLVAGSVGVTSRLELQLWPLGTVSGRVAVRQKDLKPPKEVVVKTLAVPAFLQRPPVPPGALACPVDKEGNWSCSLPSAKFDLVVTAEGFTPHYRWEVDVPAAKIVSLGTFQLVRGSSVAAWIAAEGGAIDPEQCIARLSPLAACDADLKALVKLDQTVVEAPVGKDGFLQITGIAPGNYALEVRQPGFASARVANIRVEPERETFLPEPLVLDRPITLEVEIVPPLDDRGEPWRAQVMRRNEGDAGPASIVFDGPADSSGRVAVMGQAPGMFRIVVLDPEENRIHEEAERKVDSDSRLAIELRRIAVEGRLRLGAKPLRGTLWFGGRFGSRRVKMQADEEGRFTGLLSSDGLWAVDVEGAEPELRVRTRTEVRTDRSGRASISIDLPDTRVFGQVVDERGQPAPRASLALASEGLDQHAQADDAGAFDLHGLPEGSLALLAMDDQGKQSERSVLEIIEGRSSGPVELRLRPMKRVEGTVLSSRGPVAGARVVIRAYSPTAGGGEAATGPEGTFALEIPANISTGTIVAKAPGYGTKVFPLVLDGKPLSLGVSEAAGEIDLELPQSAADLHRQNLRIILFQDNMEVPISLVGAGAAPQARPVGSPVLRLTSLAPGRYSACLVRRQVELKGAALEAGSKAAMECDSGQLAAGATLALTLRQDG